MKRRRACKVKKYMSKDAAFIAAKKTWPELQLMAYKCPYCSGWHLARHKQARMKGAEMALNKGEKLDPEDFPRQRERTHAD